MLFTVEIYFDGFGGISNMGNQGSNIQVLLLHKNGKASDHKFGSKLENEDIFTVWSIITKMWNFKTEIKIIKFHLTNKGLTVTFLVLVQTSFMSQFVFVVKQVFYRNT